MIGYLIPVGAVLLRAVENKLPVKNRLPRKRGNDEMLKPAISRNRNLRFPVAGIGRKTSRSQNIKLDVEWHVGLVENEIECGLAASSDFGKFYLMSFYRNVAWPVKSSPELVAPKCIRGNIMAGAQPEFKGVQVVFKS